VQIVNVTMMQDRHVPTLGSVEMGMLLVSGMAHQKAPLATMNDLGSFLSIPLSLKSTIHLFKRYCLTQ
jgi:hypothetical protein